MVKFFEDSFIEETYQEAAVFSGATASAVFKEEAELQDIDADRKYLLNFIFNGLQIYKGRYDMGRFTFDYEAVIIPNTATIGRFQEDIPVVINTHPVSEKHDSKFKITTGLIAGTMLTPDVLTVVLTHPDRRPPRLSSPFLRNIVIGENDA